MTPNIAQRKSALRKQKRQARGALPDDIRAAASAQICREIMEFVAKNVVSRLGLYLATPAEPSLDALILPLQQQGVELYAPHFQEENAPFYQLAPGGGNIEISTYNALALRSPAAFNGGQAMQAGNLDFILIPGLGFDTSGNRLGQGGGWYDRVLMEAKKWSKIGVCFECLVSQEPLPHQDHDQLMDFLVTEERFLDFTA